MFPLWSFMNPFMMSDWQVVTIHWLGWRSGISRWHLSLVVISKIPTAFSCICENQTHTNLSYIVQKTWTYSQKHKQTTHSSSSLTPKLFYSRRKHRGDGCYQRTADLLSNWLITQPERKTQKEYPSRIQGGWGRYDQNEWGCYKRAKKNEEDIFLVLLFHHIINCSYWHLWKVEFWVSSLLWGMQAVNAGGWNMRRVIRLAGVAHIVRYFLRLYCVTCNIPVLKTPSKNIFQVTLIQSLTLKLLLMTPIHI